MLIIKYFRKYLIDKGFKDNTITTYGGVVIQYIKWFRITKDLDFDSHLLRSDFLYFKEFLDEERKNAPASIKVKVIALKHFNTFLTEYKFQRNRVIFKEDNVNTYTSVMDNNIPTQEEVEEFKKSVLQNEKYRDYVLVLLMIETGIKISEAIQLRKDNFDSMTGSIRIRNKNTENERVLKLSTIARITLTEYVNSEVKNRGKGNNQEFEDYLFLSKRNKPLCRTRVNQIFNRNSDLITPQSLRHYYCIREIERGENLSVIMKNLGNTSIQFMKKYKMLLEQ